MADCLLQYCHILHVGSVFPSCTSHNHFNFLTASDIHNERKWWKIATKISLKSPKSSSIAPFTKRQLGIGPALTQQAQFCSAVIERYIKENTFM